VKGENVADDGIQWEVEGGDHRLLLQLDHRGQRPSVDAVAQDRGRRQDLVGRVVQRLRASPQGLYPGRGRRRRARPIRGLPVRPEAASSSWPRPHPGHRGRVPVDRRGDGARRRAGPRQGRVECRRVATGQSRWPLADAKPRRPDRDLADRPRRAGTASATRVRTTDGCHRLSLHR
jgi:hypothetical protein